MNFKSLTSRVLYQAIINANSVDQTVCTIPTRVARLAIIALEAQNARENHHPADQAPGREERREGA